MHGTLKNKGTEIKGVRFRSQRYGLIILFLITGTIVWEDVEKQKRSLESDFALLFLYFRNAEYHRQD